MADQQDLFGPTTPGVGLSTRPAAQVVPFGKYKSQPYEVLLTDASYAMYLLSSMYAKLQNQHPMLLAFLVSRYGLPDSTPEHNRLQNRFLDESFAIRFAMAAIPEFGESLASFRTINVADDWIRYVRQALAAEKERSQKRQSWDPPSRLPGLRDDLLREAEGISFIPSVGVMDDTAWLNPVAIRDLEFEKDGADVAFSVVGGGSVITTPTDDKWADEKYIGHYGLGCRSPFRIEVKPIVGDDYPAILRAMKAVNARQLLVGEYVGAGATWSELVRVFGYSGITAVLLDDVLNISSPLGKVEIHSLSSQNAEAIVSEIYDELSREWSEVGPADGPKEMRRVTRLEGTHDGDA